MDIEKILEDFAVPEGFPKDAVVAATARREELLPRFLQELEDFAAGKEEPEVPTPVFVIFHLLGSWRETRAYRAMARALMADTERVEWAFGDSVAETVHRVMLNVFDGDPQPIHDIIECETADSWVRSRMLELLALLARDGRLPRDAVVSYLRDAPDRLKPRGTHEMWVGWQRAIALLGAADLADRVRQAFKDGWIDPTIMSFEHFADDLRRIQANPDDPEVVSPDEFAPFGDFEEETGTWNWDWGQAEPEADLERSVAFAGRMADAWRQEPAANPYRDVGRNDPCPCGSGKKFKKCCGA